MKKIFAFIMAVFIMFSGFTININADEAGQQEQAETGRIEIKFRLGESSVLINGKQVTVPKPYVSEGAVFVPLRVITEAFGAELKWKGFSSEATFTYDDTSITFKMGSKEAKVNDKITTLAQSPMIQNGNAMVPLRFITEVYGATINYDASTSEIVVTKLNASPEKHGDEENDGLNIIFTKPRFGDSYYDWSLKSPANMIVGNRALDGSSITIYGDDIIFSLVVSDIEDYESELQYQLDELKSYSWDTVVKAAIQTDSYGNDYALYQTKSSYSFQDARIYVKDGKSYRLETYMAGDLSIEERNENLKLAGTFMTSFGNETNTQDLSDINEVGFVPYVNKEYQLSLNLPREWAENVYSYQSNTMSFSHRSKDYDVYGALNVAIYSKDSSMSLEDWAKVNYERNVKLYNPKKVKASEIRPRNIGNQSGVSYTVEVKLSSGDSYFIEDIYVYVGEYGYNFKTIYYSYKDKIVKVSPEEEKKSLDDMINSIKIEPLDSKKIGELQMNDPVDYTLSKKFLVLEKKASIYLPKSFSSDWGDMISDSETGMSLIFMETKDSTSLADYKVHYKSLIEETKAYPGITIKSGLQDITIGSLKGFTYSYETDENEGYYSKVWVLHKSGTYYIITSMVPEQFVGGSMEKALNEAVKTFELSK